MRAAVRSSRRPAARPAVASPSGHDALTARVAQCGANFMEPATLIPRFSDHAANERTYLAWVRTAIAVMAFGFLVERFDLFFTYASQTATHAARRLHMHLRTTEWVGLALIVFGALIIVLASARFLRNRRDIALDQTEAYAGPAGEKLLAAILVLLGLFLVIYVGQELSALGAQPDG